MILTEAEAKTKWCPFARELVHQLSSGAVIVNNRVAADAPCMASGCMAWRWAQGGDVFADGAAKCPAGHFAEQCGCTPDRVVRLQRGYCGLAGKP